MIPPAVLAELTAADAPEKIRAWFENQPSWLEKRDLSSDVDENLSDNLDKGESEAIQLAKNLGADLIVIDDLAARRIAVENGLRVIGMIGALANASKNGLIDAEEVIAKLESANFYVSADLIELLRESKN